MRTRVALLLFDVAERQPLLLTRLRVILRGRAAAAERLTIPDASFTLSCYNDADCLDKFRSNKTDIGRLVVGLALPDVDCRERTARTKIEAVCVLLRRCAVPDRLACMHHNKVGVQVWRTSAHFDDATIAEWCGAGTGEQPVTLRRETGLEDGVFVGTVIAATSSFV
ncbi:hypothetical protein H257_16494 [Aphanomyces astaci]|uniref:Uncharacterized protein n=1 Tax=Aphanomyces astaci TaxID=112090 RepID=W4FK66_APHAT|nr:hypothetical protein H257_16494 [Aphanomyces astaci]ETV67251.1 hypothetical protein H257_16494 [Aphanomyces astaci]|eukprot:XP_009843239.1 hypothetical protein H257_16494 [Aphanomyces astaci]